MKLSIRQWLQFSILLILAAVLRFFRLTDLPYSHDELSALSRLDFSSFSDLLNFGVRPDGHPALVHVFLFYWTKIFGTSEEMVKLPFIVSGLAVVAFVYLIGLKWLGEQTAFFSATTVALSQYFIIYSQYARPYITGCLLALLLVHFLLRILFSLKISFRDYFFFTLFLVLSALNHHISMLFASLVFLSGVLLVSKERRKKYLMASGAAALAYLPHLSITLSQFSIGGVGGWLSPPEPEFLFKFLYFLIHYSWPLMATIVFVFIFSFFRREKSSVASERKKIQYLFFLLFFCSFLITFFYSLFRNPVLQLSSLIFSAPFFILAFFSLLPQLKLNFHFLFSILFVALFIQSLATNRKFFDLNFRQGFEQFVKVADTYKRKYPNKKISMIVRSEKWFIDFYQKKWNTSIPVIFEPNDVFFSPDSISRILDTLSSQIILIGNLEPQQIAQFMNRYPEELYSEIGYSYEINVLMEDSIKKSSPFLKATKKQFLRNFKNSYPDLEFDKTKVDAANQSLSFQNSNEFPVTFSIPFDSLCAIRGDHLLATILIDSLTEPSNLCISVSSDNSVLFYTDAVVPGKGPNADVSQKSFASMFCGDAISSWKNAKLKVYLWNKNGGSGRIRSLTLQVLSANPYRFSLLEKIEDSEATKK